MRPVPAKVPLFVVRPDGLLRLDVRGRVSGFIACVEEISLGGAPWFGDLTAAEEGLAERLLAQQAFVAPLDLAA